MDDWDLMSYILAGACHDLGHPGFNNLFLIEKGDEIAVRYNDASVLENYHAANSFAIINQERYNIFAELSPSEYKRVRKQIIGAILATDMALHFSKVGIFKGKIENDELDPTDFEEKRFLCELIFHLCDISNVAKLFHLSEKWINLLYFEFF